MKKNEVLQKVGSALEQYLGVSKPQASGLLSPNAGEGKLYEAYILGIIARELTTREGCTLVLRNSNSLTLKSGGGGINRVYPRVDVFRGGELLGELWTDIEFTTLSYAKVGGQIMPCHYHELDIVLVPPLSNGKPPAADLIFAVECKNVSIYDKSLLREILGIRRELSLLTAPPMPTVFTAWPRAVVPADPPSCLVVYSTNAAVVAYKAVGDVFGIDFFHEPII
jgi:hypothetical protein